MNNIPHRHGFDDGGIKLTIFGTIKIPIAPNTNETVMKGKIS